MAEDIAKKVFELKGKNLSQRKIAVALGIKRSEVQKILKNPGPAATKPATNPSTAGPTTPTKPTTTSPDDDEDEKGIPETFERELWLKATPLIRKVALNPEIYFWYDYAKGKLGLEGDVGDFICDCVRYFFKSHGYKIQVIKEEEIA